MLKRRSWPFVTFSLAFTALAIGSIWLYGTTRDDERAPGQPQWQTVKSFPMTATCQEDGSSIAGRYEGDLVWRVEIRSGVRESYVILAETSEDTEKWVEASLKALQSGRGRIYRPPSVVLLSAEGHVVPTIGQTASHDRPRYAVSCDVALVP